MPIVPLSTVGWVWRHTGFDTRKRKHGNAGKLVAEEICKAHGILFQNRVLGVNDGWGLIEITCNSSIIPQLFGRATGGWVK